MPYFCKALLTAHGQMRFIPMSIIVIVLGYFPSLNICFYRTSEVLTTDPPQTSIYQDVYSIIQHPEGPPGRQPTPSLIAGR